MKRPDTQRGPTAIRLHSSCGSIFNHIDMVPLRLSHLKTRAFIAMGVSLLLAISGVTLATVVLTIWSAAPAVRDYEARETTVIYDADGGVLAGLYEEDRIWVSLDEIPPQLQQAFIAIEDHNFRRHRGVDVRAMIRALVVNVRNLRIVEGASTITQQLARNVYLDHARTFTRKLQEIRIALDLERRYTKAEILEMYLNEIYLGSGAYGVQAAAERYFDKDVDELELHEIATLAALPRSPQYYSPHHNPDAARERRDLVLQTMSGLGYITQVEADAAAGHDLEVTDEPLEAVDIGHYFVKHVRNQLIARFGADHVYTGGLRVYTTLDRDKQKAAEDAIGHTLETGMVPTHSAGGESRVAEEQPQPALVTVDTNTGAVPVMIGGRGDDSLNRATQSARQPGSAFKPFVYAAAIHSGHYPGTIVNDLPVVFDHPDDGILGEVWPVNYDHRYRGLISYRDAIAYSVNVAAVRTLAELGVEAVRRHVDRYGFSTLTEQDGSEDHYAFALGGLQRGVSPLEMATAYGVFHDGRTTPPTYTITRVEAADGTVVFERDEPEAESNEEPGAEPDTPENDTDKVLSDAEAYLMRDMLRTVMDRGTGRHAAQEIPFAGKTGTTDNNTDGWFVGFADEMVTAVWLGEDAPAPMEYTTDEDGEVRRARDDEAEITLTGVHASRIWGEYIGTVLAADNDNDNDNDNDKPNRWEQRERPDEVIEVEIDPITGLAPSRQAPLVEKELATKDSAPEKVSGFWDEIETAEVDLRSGRLVSPVCVFPYPETQRYIVDGRYRIGPARIHLGGTDDFVTSGGELFEGIYEVGTYEPVQKIDPKTRVPVDPASIAIERVPALPCLLPTEQPDKPDEPEADEDPRIELLE